MQAQSSRRAIRRDCRCSVSIAPADIWLAYRSRGGVRRTTKAQHTLTKLSAPFRLMTAVPQGARSICRSPPPVLPNRGKLRCYVQDVLHSRSALTVKEHCGPCRLPTIPPTITPTSASTEKRHITHARNVSPVRQFPDDL